MNEDWLDNAWWIKPDKKQKIMKETDQDYGGFVAWFVILPVCVIASLFRKIFR